MQRLALPSRAGCHPRGFTRVEFVMVMIMVAVLVALVMPAIQASREESRRAVCGHNLHLLGYAGNCGSGSAFRWDDEACRKHTDLYATHDAWVSGRPMAEDGDGK